MLVERAVRGGHSHGALLEMVAIATPEGGDPTGEPNPEAELTEGELLCLAESMLLLEPTQAECDSIVQLVEKAEGSTVESLRAKTFSDYETSAFSSATSGNPQNDLNLAKPRFY